MTSADLHLSPSARETVVRHVRLALGRFGERVEKVTIRIAEPANPLGGVDRRCRMTALLEGDGEVRSEAINGKVEAAVGRAAARLATGVAWALEAGAGTRTTAAQGAKRPMEGPSHARRRPSERRRRAASIARRGRGAS